MRGMRALLSGVVAVVVAVLATAALAQPSDWRLKRNVERVASERALEVVVALRPVRFEWNDDQVAFALEGEHFGLLAQEVIEILPEVVHDRGGFLVIEYDELVPILVGALQQQQRLLEQESARVDELEARLAALEE